ncbi:reprolysin-like metallopeptidase [Acanthopleuribacter pedis]|nr:M12 family metallo-peptidase [Acanthopleuribacter pedis]
MYLFLFSVLGFLDHANPAPTHSDTWFPYQNQLPAGKQGDPLLERFPTPLGDQRVELKKMTVWAPGAILTTVRLQKTTTGPVPSRSYYQGTTAGGDRLVLARHAPGVYRGFLRGPRQTWAVTWRDNQVGYKPAHAKAFDAKHPLGVAGIAQRALTQKTAAHKNDGPVVVDMAFEANSLLANRFEADPEALIATITDSIAVLNAFYGNDLNVRVRISYLAIFAENDPWGFSLADFRNHWLDPANGKTTVHRHLAFRLFGRGSSGAAYINGVDNPNWGYGDLSFVGALAADPSDLSDITLLGHELGHSLGGIHTHDFFPPIDLCSKVTGNIPADGGTIMSYCNFQVEGNLPTRFHPQNAALITENLAQKSGLTTLNGPLTIPDPIFQQALVSAYDTNGDGAISLLEAEAVRELDLRNSGVRDLTGLRHLVNLTSLDARHNAIQHLPAQIPAGLQVLNLANNPLSAANCALLGAYEQHGFSELTLSPIAPGGFLPCDTRFVSFPDAALAAAVTAAADSNSDGRVSLKEAQRLTVLSAVAAGISDLTGIEALVNLRRLNLSQNTISSLPTLPSQITELILAENQLTEIDAVTALTQISMLDVTDNQLRALPFFENRPFFYTLLASNNQLESLPDLNGAAFPLETLDVSNNQIGDITALPELLFHLNLSNNQLRTIPVIPAINYPNSQFIDISNNPFENSVENCTRLGELLERNKRGLVFEPGGDALGCTNLDLLPPLRAHLPWVVNNPRFLSEVSLTHRGEEVITVFVRAEDANGAQVERFTLSPGQRLSNLLEIAFPGFDRAALSLHSYSPDVLLTTTLTNRSGPSQGARASTQADIYESLPNKLLFTGLSEQAALALSAPGNTGTAAVELRVSDAFGRVLGVINSELTNGVPNAIPLSELGASVAGQSGLTVLATLEEGKRLSGNSFLFEGWAETATARGQTYYGNPGIYAVPVGSERNMTITLHNPLPAPLLVLARIFDNDNPRGLSAPVLVLPLATSTVRPGDLYPGEGDIGLQFFGNSAFYTTVKLEDETGSGAPSPAFSELFVAFDLGNSADFVLADDTTQATLYIHSGIRRPMGTITVQLRDTDGSVLGEQAVPYFSAVAQNLDLGDLFPGQDVAGKTLRVATPAPDLISALLRQSNGTGRSSLTSSNGR